MKKLNYRLIFCDFDGTLANSKNEVPEYVAQAIRDYEAEGGMFVVCSGRMLKSIQPRVRKLGIGYIDEEAEGVVVACQGAVIAQVWSQHKQSEQILPEDLVIEICKYFEEIGINTLLYYTAKHCHGLDVSLIEGYLSSLPEGDEYLSRYEEIIGVKAHHAKRPLYEVADGAEKDNAHFIKVATLCHPKDQQLLFEKIKARFGDKCDVTCSASVLIELNPKDFDKGRALTDIAKWYNIPIEKTIAIGDNLNDLSMIKAAGLGVAVGNATKELKDAADYVSVTNDEGAVAEIIERFGYIQND